MSMLTPFLPQTIRYAGTAFPDVEPFSIRAGASFEEIQYSMVVWIRDQLTPYLVDNKAGPVWDANAAALVATVNEALGEQEDRLTETFGQFAASSVTAPPPSGDTSGTADTAALQAIMDTGKSIILQAGTYYVNGLSAPVATTQPSIRGQGKTRTFLSIVGSATGIRYRGPLGTGTLTGVNLEGFTITGGTGIAIQFAGVCGAKWRQLKIDGPFSTGIQFLTEVSGDWTEFNSGELETSTAVVGPHIEYKAVLLNTSPVMPAGKSFHGSGLTEGSILNQRYNATSPVILVNPYALPYNAPMQTQIFLRTPGQPAIQNNNITDYVNFRGQLTIEQFVDGCTVAGAADNVNWPVWNTGSLNAYGKTGLIVGAMRFADRIYTPGSSSYPAFVRRPWQNSKALAAGSFNLIPLSPRSTYQVSVRIYDGAGYEYDQLLYVVLRPNVGDGSGWTPTVLANPRNADSGGKGAPVWSVVNNQLVVTNPNYTSSFIATYAVQPMAPYIPIS